MFQVFFSLLHDSAQKQPSAINALHFHFFEDKLNIDIPNRTITKPLKSPQIQARERQKARPLMQKSYLAAITVLRLQKFKHKLKGIIHQEATAIKAERTPFESNLPRPAQPSLEGCSSIHADVQFLQWCSAFWNPERNKTHLWKLDPYQAWWGWQKSPLLHTSYFVYRQVHVSPPAPDL